jgi:hypothetical protein
MRFAPGWTLECDANHDRIAFERNENRFWNGIEKIEMLKEWKVEDGGSGWKCEKEKGHNHKDTCWTSSFDWCRRFQRIDLYEFNSKEFWNKEQPMISLVQWYCGTGPNVKDIFYWKVQLRNEKEEIIQKYESGELICSSDQWESLYHEFKNYGKNARYLDWEDGGKDAEYWAGHFGSRVSG